MITDWLATLGVITATGLLSGGVGAALVQGLFHRADPETKAKAGDIIIDSAAVLVKQYMDSNIALSKSNSELRKSNEALMEGNAELTQEIRRMRDAIRSVLDAFELVKPMLPVENGRMMALDRALDAARQRVS